jgi:hypothetical protein
MIVQICVLRFASLTDRFVRLEGKPRDNFSGMRNHLKSKTVCSLMREKANHKKEKV